jgi:preprotein translocase subunit SecD
MHRIVTWTACSLVLLFSGIMQAEAQFSIRAASARPVEGWQQMQVEHSDRTVWVAPTAAVVASDIEKAQPEVRADGTRVIRVVFTDGGANKIRDLTTAQLKKYVAMVVDGKLIWAPLVQVVVGKESVLAGNLPSGLTEEETDRIMASLRQLN